MSVTVVLVSSPPQVPPAGPPPLPEQPGHPHSDPVLPGCQHPPPERCLHQCHEVLQRLVPPAVGGRHCEGGREGGREGEREGEGGREGGRKEGKEGE